MATYVIDNGQIYSDHVIHFVEGPEDFGSWFEEMLVPWFSEHDMSGRKMKIIATSPGELSWRVGGSLMRWDDFLINVFSFEDMDYDVDPPQHRPRYQGV